MLRDDTHETTPLDIILEGDHSIIAFNAIKLFSNPIVLGHFWLDKYNLAIDWKTRTLIFQSNIALIQESCYVETSLVPDHQKLKLHHGKILKIQAPLVVGARAFIRTAKKRAIFAIYAMLITESANGHEVLLTHYKEYQDVFEKKNADMLP
jgi:hypothetical protein